MRESEQVVQELEQPGITILVKCMAPETTVDQPASVKKNPLIYMGI